MSCCDDCPLFRSEYLIVANVSFRTRLPSSAIELPCGVFNPQSAIMSVVAASHAQSTDQSLPPSHLNLNLAFRSYILHHDNPLPTAAINHPIDTIGETSRVISRAAMWSRLSIVCRRSLTFSIPAFRQFSEGPQRFLSSSPTQRAKRWTTEEDNLLTQLREGGVPAQQYKKVIRIDRHTLWIEGSSTCWRRARKL